MFDFSKNSKPYKITLSVFALLLIFSLIAAIIPSWRENFRSLFFRHERTILTKSRAPLNPEGPELVVFKVKIGGELFIEVYKNNELLVQLLLDGRQDGFLNFQNQATNLALMDINNDGYTDIVAPTFDDGQQARMNVFQYDQEAQSYIRAEKEK